MAKSLDSSSLLAKISKEIDGKNILVTGGAGSIGNEIVKRLLTLKPKVIRIIENNEANLFKLQQEVSTEDVRRIRFFLGDIRDYARLKKAMKNIDIVFHAAAFKHVEMSEENPFEAIKTNVYGTENAIEAAIESGVKKFVNVSTDKAASPLNVMGATKLLGEKLVTAAEQWKGIPGPTFCSVRFGNVFGSKGSVYPILRHQILNNKSATITNPDMTRFIMSIPDAIDLIMFALVEMKGGEVFLPKMKSVLIDDLITYIVNYICNKFDKDRSMVEIEKIDVRAGEKIHEFLITNDELPYAYEYRDYYIILPTLSLPILDEWKTRAKKIDVDSVSSDNLDNIMTEQDLIELMDEAELNNRIFLS